MIKIIKKARDPYISPPRRGATAKMIFTKLDRVAETLDVITLSKFQINWFMNVALVSCWSLCFSTITAVAIKTAKPCRAACDILVYA